MSSNGLFPWIELKGIEPGNSRLGPAKSADCRKPCGTGVLYFPFSETPQGLAFAELTEVCLNGHN